MEPDEGERVEKSSEAIPCGTRIKTTYLDKDGQVVRQDIVIEVSEEFMTRAKAGQL